MKLDLIYLDDKILVSKEIAEWQHWQKKFYYYKTSLPFEDEEDLIDFLITDYKLTGANVDLIHAILSDTNTKIFYLQYDGNNKEELVIEKLAIDILDDTEVIIDFKAWQWLFYQKNEEYILWVYLGGIADLTHSIALSQKQVQLFVKNGKQYVISLAEELGTLNSTVYAEAVKDGRRR